MSSTIQGISVSGFQYSGRKSFDSFPGLIFWIDPRVGVTKQAANGGQRVKTFQERGPNNFNWTEQNGSGGVFMATIDEILCFAASSVQAGMENASSPNLANWKPLSDGSPWSLYYLMNVTSGATGGSNFFRPFSGSRFRISGNPMSGGSGKSITVTIFDDVGAGVFSLSTGGGAYVYSTWSLVEILHKGQANAVGNDMEVYVNDVLKGTANWGAGVPGTGFSQTKLMETNSGTSLCRMGFAVAYNNTGKLESQINAERTEIRNLILELYGI